MRNGHQREVKGLRRLTTPSDNRHDSWQGIFNDGGEGPMNLIKEERLIEEKGEDGNRQSQMVIVDDEERSNS